MDLLVSSYFSDEEMENQGNKKNGAKKWIDDEISSDDSVEIILETSKSQKVYECICIDDSDDEVAGPSKDNICSSAINKEVLKEVNYLNLESSDTDEEQESIQNRVNSLLSSAAILNDIECGPTETVRKFPGLIPFTSIPFLSSHFESSPLIGKRSNSPALAIQEHDNNSIPFLSDFESSPLFGKRSNSPALAIQEHDNNSIPFLSDFESSPLFGKRSNSSALATQEYDKNNRLEYLPRNMCHNRLEYLPRNMCHKDNNEHSFQENVSNKKIKLNQFITDNRLYVDTMEEFNLKNRMYREDDRIIAACKKKYVSHIPSTLSQTINAHKKAISSLSWCAVPYSHLFLSSSLDCTVKIWDIYAHKKTVQSLNLNLGVRAAKWSSDKEQIIAGGFGKKLHIIDAFSGKEHMAYDIFNSVSCIAIHPFIEDVVLCGTNNAIFGYDLRVNCKYPVRTFLSKCGEVLDIVFLNKNEFVCSTSIVSHDSADRTIMVWDFNSGVIMSNQIFLERYTCPSLKVNPFDSSFIAQTNGDYIASFSSQRPYKIKKKTYIGHKVSGFGIKCDISPDGQYVASGDAKGGVYFYNYANTRLVKKLTLKPNVATNRLEWHPVFSSIIAVATWDGQIHVLN